MITIIAQAQTKYEDNYTIVTSSSLTRAQWLKHWQDVFSNRSRKEMTGLPMQLLSHDPSVNKLEQWNLSTTSPESPGDLGSHEQGARRTLGLLGSCLAWRAAAGRRLPPDRPS